MVQGSDNNEAIIIDNREEIFWSDREADIVIGSSAEKNEIIIADISTNVFQEFPTQQIVIEEEQNVTEIDRLPAISFDVSDFANDVYAKTLSVLPAETWTDFPETLIETVTAFKVKDLNGNDITDSFEYRQVDGIWQIYSLRSYTNLIVEMEG